MDYVAANNWEAFLLWTEFGKGGTLFGLVWGWVLCSVIVCAIAKMLKNEDINN